MWSKSHWLNDLGIQIQRLVVEDKQAKWQSAVDKCDHRTGISHLWRLVNGLSGKQPHNSPNKGVWFSSKTYLDPKMIANKFAHQFTPPPKIVWPAISPKDSSNGNSISCHYQEHHLSRLPTLKKRSDWPSHPQPSGQTDEHHPPPETRSRCINYLTNIFNLSISTGLIP